ncbi:MAG: helix-hairpin-helix domain-containing protein [Candidatus Thorarchaeota archaeon]|nr:helix-hairpin-helix domain-containing protein [Candidatus Thorarchaeota archaeon]
MSEKKKSKKKPEIIQETLGELVKSEPKKKPAPKKKDESKLTKKAKSSPKKRKTPKKDTKPSKAKSSEKPKPKIETSPMSDASSEIPLQTLPGVGPKLAQKLIAAGYISVEQLSRARPDAISKRVDGLSKVGASNLTAAAKDLLRKIKSESEPKEEIPQDEEIADEIMQPMLKLTDIPGVGAKLALSLERAGYTSVARLSRSRPDAVAAKVDGLSIASATKLVDSAKEIERDQEIERVIGEPSTVIAAKKVDTKTDTKEKETPVEPSTEPIKKAKRKPSKKKEKKVEAPVKKPPKKAAAPPKKKPKPVKKKSNLKVSPAIVKLAAEMKQNWIAAEERAKEPKVEGAEGPAETVEVINLTADDTTERLVEAALDILNETMTTGRPAFEIPSRSGDNIVWDEVRDLLLLGMRTISRPYHSLASVVDATRTARVMEIVYNLLKANLHATKREVYYSDVNLFRDQKYSDKIVEDVASMLQTTRDSVHIVASARGSAMGRVTIRDGGDLIDLTKMGTGGWAVTPFLDQLEIVESDAEFILLSEKDAAVMRLAEAKYWNRQPCIVITGKGSGDIATRAFLKMLVKELEIPAFALVDSDPYGHYIYSVFLRGSKRLSYESPFIATPELKLLGVLTRDLDEYKIPKAVRIPMTPADVKRVKDMLKEPFVQQNKPWVEDLQLMLKMKEKAEIQAFASHSFQYLTDEYLPRKLNTGDWI